jgi:hypothetical protein
LSPISPRHSHKRSTIITTNTAFSEWGNILYNTTIATAIVDRLVENTEIFLLAGDAGGRRRLLDERDVLASYCTEHLMCLCHDGLLGARPFSDNPVFRALRAVAAHQRACQLIRIRTVFSLGATWCGCHHQ